MNRVKPLDQTFVIVDAGLAGAKAAETLRVEGFDGRLVMIGAEAGRPYERPPLSREYLRGEVGREKLYVHDEDFYAANEIELRLGRTAVSLDTSTNEVALDDGKRVRRNMLGLSDRFDRVPYFFSDQYDVGMEYSGFARTWDRVVFRGDPATREFIAFWLLEDRVVAGMNVGVWDVTDAIERLIRARVAVDDRRLADADIPLDDVAAVETKLRRAAPATSARS